LNRERAKELLPIIEAFANGEDIQARRDAVSNWLTMHTETAFPDDFEYRIKPKPREFWIADVSDEFRKVLLPGQKDLSADHQYIKVREIIE